MIDQGENRSESNRTSPHADHFSSNKQPSTNRQQFACLYTKHKTQKHKKWSDGRLIVDKYSCRLHDAEPQPGAGDPMIDSCSISGAEAESILSGQRTDVETEKFLITIDGPWKGPTMAILPSQTTASQQRLSKLLQKKFRKPKRVVPPPCLTSSITPALTKRQRPLQPGELHKRYYGSQRTEAPPPQLSHGQQPEAQQRKERAREFISSSDGFNASNFYEEEETDATSYPPPRLIPTLEPRRDNGVSSPQESSADNATTSQVQASWFLSPRENFEEPYSHQPKLPDGYPKESEEDLPRNDPQAFSFQPPPSNTFFKKPPIEQVFAVSSDFQASQYYGDESHVDEEDEPEPATAPQAFSVPVSYHSVPQEKASRTELLDIFSDKPSTPATTDEFMLPDESSSDES